MNQNRTKYHQGTTGHSRVLFCLKLPSTEGKVSHGVNPDCRCRLSPLPLAVIRSRVLQRDLTSHCRPVLYAISTRITDNYMNNTHSFA